MLLRGKKMATVSKAQKKLPATAASSNPLNPLMKMQRWTGPGLGLGLGLGGGVLDANGRDTAERFS